MQKILVIFLRSMGDVLRSLAVFDILRQRYPDAFIAALSEPLGAEMLRSDDRIDHVFEFCPDEVKETIGAHKRFFGCWYAHIVQLTEGLRRCAFDLIIDFQLSEISSLIVYYLAPRRFIGRSIGVRGEARIAGERMKELYLTMRNVDNRRVRNKTALAELLVQCLEDIGIVGERGVHTVSLGDEEKTFADAFLSAHGYRNTQLLIGLQPGVGHFYHDKAWPVERFALLADYLHHTYGAVILINGSPAERKAVVTQLLERSTSPAIIAAGRTSLKQAAALIARCHLFVSNDSGPMHLAAAVGTPTIGLFGRYFPFESRPCGSGHSMVVRTTVHEITLEEVVRACAIQLMRSGWIARTIGEREWATVTNMNKSAGIFVFE